jgi:hypothetical protein
MADATAAVETVAAETDRGRYDDDGYDGDRGGGSDVDVRGGGDTEDHSDLRRRATGNETSHVSLVPPDMRGAARCSSHPQDQRRSASRGRARTCRALHSPGILVTMMVRGLSTERA